MGAAPASPGTPTARAITVPVSARGSAERDGSTTAAEESDREVRLTDEPGVGAPPPSPTASHPVVVFAGGDPPRPSVATLLPSGALVVAADSGLHHALNLGLHVDLVVGDLDSADPAAVGIAAADGATVQQHPAEKDATDLEIALDAARRLGASEVLVIGAGGGRLDHFLANALLLASPAFAPMRVEAIFDRARVVAVHDRVELAGRPGDLVTLLALGGSARGVSTEGLRYPLDDEDLHPGSSRGVSNEFVASAAMVKVRSGTLLAVLPFGAEE